MTADEKMIQELKEWGVVSLDNNEIAHLFLDHIGDGPPSCDFMDKFGLHVFFFYDRQEQPDEWKKHGGMCWRFDHETEAPLYAIGISKQTISAGSNAQLRRSCMNAPMFCMAKTTGRMMTVSAIC